MLNKIIFLSLLISFNSWSQHRTIDSLLFKIENTSKTEEKITALNELSRFYIYYSPKEAIKEANKALVLSKRSSNKRGEINSLINIGFYYLRVDDYEKASEILYESLILSQEIDYHFGLGEASYLQARVYNGLGQYEWSMKNLIKAEKHYDSIRYKGYLGRVYETMGDLNDKFGNYELAIKNLNKSLDLKIKHNDDVELARTYAYLGNVYAHLNKDEQALKFYKMGLEASIKSNNLNSEAYILTKMGNFYLTKKKLEKATTYYERALDISIKHQNNWGTFRINLGLSRIDFMRKLYPKALKKALNSLEIAKSIQDDEGRMSGFKLLSEIYEEMGRIEEAFLAYKKFVFFEEALFDKEQTADITMNEVSHKQEREINKINEEKRRRELEQKQKDIINQKDKHQKEQIVILLISFSIIVLIFSVFQYRRYAIMKEQKKIIEKQTNQNLLLMKNLSNHDKMSTVGEISSNIAHELNSPLGTVKASAEGIDQSFKSLLQNNGWGCSQKEIEYALDHAMESYEKPVTSGKKRAEEANQFLDLLNKNYKENEHNESLADLMTTSTINISDIETIDFTMQTNDPTAFLNLLNNIKSILYFIQVNLSSSKKVSDKVADLRSYLMTEKLDSKKRINMANNIETILNLFSHELNQEIQFKRSLDHSLYVNAFPVLLHQLWSNLLKNAIEALEETKGTKSITIKLYTLNQITTVEFCNNGSQINEEEKEKIFENLYTTKEKSAGLGLGIVKNVIDTHRAKIELNSTPKRTCFKISFPNENLA